MGSNTFIEIVGLIALPVTALYFMAVRRSWRTGPGRYAVRVGYLLTSGHLIFTNHRWNSVVDAGIGQWAWWAILAFVSWCMVLAAYEVVKGPKQAA